MRKPVAGPVYCGYASRVARHAGACEGPRLRNSNSRAARLDALQALRLRFGKPAAARRAALVRQLSQARFADADELARFHELLLWSAAYPDDREGLAQVLATLEGFSLRPELKRFAGELVNSGIAGCDIHYNFFWMMARWLAKRCPGQLELDPAAPGCHDRLRAALPLLVGALEGEAVRRSNRPTPQMLAALAPTRDAASLIGAIEAIAGDGFTREHLHDSIDPSYVLRGSRGFPSRTTARCSQAPMMMRSAAPPLGRPDLAAALARPPKTQRRIEGSAARHIVELAREAMLTRERDLAAFSWGDERDVLLVDDGDGLAFAIIGSQPERRLPLPAVHGWIMLRNRVPVGYVQTDTLLRGTEVAFNLFPTFRGGEAAHLFARVLAVSCWVLGARAFSIEPYQLGEGNEEGIESGAWWFYYRLGFRPIADGPRAALARELQRLRRSPGHRSSAATLRRLAAGHLVFEPDSRHRVLLPAVPGLGLRERIAAEAVAGELASRRFGVRSVARWSPEEQRAWQRLSPLLAALPGVEWWTASEKRTAVLALRAKGGRHETEYLRRVDAHPKLCAALTDLLAGARSHPASAP